MYLLSKGMTYNFMYIPLMMIHKITPSADYDKCLNCFDTELNEPSNQP